VCLPDIDTFFIAWLVLFPTSGGTLPFIKTQTQHGLEEEPFELTAADALLMCVTGLMAAFLRFYKIHHPAGVV
jgi:hypothetical protein